MVITSIAVYILKPHILCDEDQTMLLSLQGVYNDYPIIVDKLDAISLANDGNCIKMGGLGTKTKHIDNEIAHLVQFAWKF